MVRLERGRWRKLAGILAEGASDGGGIRTVVLGMGINIERSDAPADVASRMIALSEVAMPTPDRTSRLVADLVTALFVRLEHGVAPLSRGALEEVRAAWTALAPSVHGTAVAWDVRGERQGGVTRGLGTDGGLRVETASGLVTTLHGGDVTWMLEGATA